MEDGLGEDLSWFWRGWLYTTDVVDQAVDSVTALRDSAGAAYAAVFLSSPGALPMPVDLRLSFADGAKAWVRLPVEIWLLRNRYVYIRPAPTAVVQVEIDPQQSFPDVRRDNNVWAKPGAGAGTGR